MEENSKEMPQTENKKNCKKNCLFVIIIAIIAIVIAVVFFVHSYNDNDYYGHYSKEEKLANSGVMWNRRIAVLACFPKIKDGDFKMILSISKKLLKDKEDLMHKAVGWMLREVYKKDNKILLNFINKNYAHIPRTTLRYAIEKIEEQKRKEILNRSR